MEHSTSILQSQLQCSCASGKPPDSAGPEKLAEILQLLPDQRQEPGKFKTQWWPLNSPAMIDHADPIRLGWLWGSPLFWETSELSMCRFQWKDPRPQIDEEPWSLPRGPNAWDATPFQSTKPSPPDCIDIALIYGQKIAARRCSSHHGSNPRKHPLPTFGVRIINDTSIDHDVNALMGTISIQSVTLNGETATEHQAISMSWVVCGHIINSDWKRQISLGQNSDTSSSIPWCSEKAAVDQCTTVGRQNRRSSFAFFRKPQG